MTNSSTQVQLSVDQHVICNDQSSPFLSSDAVGDSAVFLSSAVNTDSWMLPDALASRRPSCENGRSAATMTEVSTSDLVIGELLLLP